MSEADVLAVRAAGFDDRAIVDANQVVAYFNYVNRIAEGLGVELEPTWPSSVRARRRYALAGRSDGFPVVSGAALPWLSVAQMREVDRVAIEELGLALEQMMENAGRNLAVVARRLLGGTARGRPVVVLAGPGGNGGGGMVAARHLAVAGADVSVVLDREPERLAAVPRRQYSTLRALGIPTSVAAAGELGAADLVVDALLGYGQTGAPRGATADLIEASAGRRVLALDVPSGLELATGTLHDPHIRAETTLTLALPKSGLGAGSAKAAVGELLLADISIPASVYERLDLAGVVPFGSSPIVRIAES
jgi:NAD(P)H-hydrate epimerase